jgi:hypothetical protein
LFFVVPSLITVVAVLVAFSPSAAAAEAAPAKVTISKATANGTTVTIAGRVTLPSNLKRTVKNLKKVTVALTLAAPTGKKETFTTKITSKRTFKLTKTTKLTGTIKLSAQVKVNGKASGRKLAKTVSGLGASPAPSGANPAGTSPTGTSPTGAGSTEAGPTGASPVNPPPPGANKLNGLLRLDSGTQSVAGTISGSFFTMEHDGIRVVNGSSPFYDSTYTPLRPGSDGGLSTVKYQPAPSPAFAGGDTGGSLASSITLPQAFLNINFAITTDPIDRQTGLPSPLPEIYEKDGKLFGQTSAWDAQWNGLSFNQGAPKPDGSYPVNPGRTPSFGNGGTVAVFGTYDSATRHFILKWQSLIISGPFDTYSGEWNLEGTFEPAA